MNKIFLAGYKVFWYRTLESTMDTIMELSAGEEIVVVAEEQSKGRGRQGKIWESPCGGLWMSTVWYHCDDLLVPYLSILSAAAVADVLESHGILCRMKLPNDLYVSGKKIAGILVEKSEKSAIIGIGINVNRHETALLEYAVSMSEIAGRTFDLLFLLEEILLRLAHHRELFSRTPSAALECWAGLLRR